MRKTRLLMTSMALFGAMGSLNAQTDVTSTYIINADFESGIAIDNGICTYAKDVAANNTTYSGLQAVNSWTPSVTGADAMAGGVFAYGGAPFLGGAGYLAPATDNAGNTGNALGIVNVWGADSYYSQELTNLQPGDYTLTLYVYNAKGGTTAITNKMGFVESGGNTHYATTTQYAVDQWTKETINFSIARQSSGTLTLGYKSMGSGSSANPHLFVDNLSLTYTATVVKVELQSAISSATAANDVLQNSTLAAAISTAQGVYDNVDATQTEVDQAVNNLNAAVAEAKNNIPDNTNVTSLFVTNNSFETGDYTGWTYNTANDTRITTSSGVYVTAGIDGNYLFNTWGGTAEKYIKQTLTNLPEGYYMVSALYASDANLTAKLIAGSSTTVVSPSSTGNGTFVEVNSDKVFVAGGGSLEIGITSTDWYKVDNFRLTFFSASTAAQEAYNKAKTDAQAALGNADYANISGNERTNLQQLVDATTPTTTDGYNAATTNLQTALTTFTAAKAAYDGLAAAQATADPSLPYASEAAKTAFADAINATTSATAAEATTQTQAITTALRAYYESNAKAEGVTDAVAYTSSITNPEGSNVTGWTVDKGTINKGGIGILSGEPWTGADGNSTHSYFDGGSWGDNAWEVTFKQTISLPAGKYLLSAMARAERDLTTFRLIAGDQKADMPHISSVGGVFNRGWNSNYVVFESTGNPVTIGVTGVAATVHQWMSFADFKLYKIGDATAQEVTISENSTFTPEDAYANVTLNRTIAANKWNSVVLPFDLSNAELTAAFGSDVAIAEFSENSADAENATVDFTKMTTPAITANTPVLLKTSAAGASYTFTGKTIKPATTVQVAGTNFSFVGSYYASKTLDNTCYFISNNTLFKSEGATTLAGTRAYIAPNGTTPAKIGNLIIDGETVTGIDGITTTDNDTAPIYNLSGQRVNKAVKGVYIQNGKKFIKK